jgi:hypothetical protein
MIDALNTHYQAEALKAGSLADNRVRPKRRFLAQTVEGLTATFQTPKQKKLIRVNLQGKTLAQENLDHSQSHSLDRRVGFKKRDCPRLDWMPKCFWPRRWDSTG